MSMKNSRKYSELYFQFFSVVIISLCSIVLLIRSFYSFSWSDESFYLTIVHRFWLGERILQDEWYTTQLSTPLLLPFYSFFEWITGGNEGIYLYYRIIYWGISTVTAFLIFFKLKRWNKTTAALFSGIIYLLYSRANIGGMSYYNMTLTLVLISTVLVYDQIMAKQSQKGILLLTGVLLALAVVNTPYLVIPYIMIALFLLLSKKYRFLWRKVMLVFIGMGITAIAYMAYVLSKTSLEEILLNIPYILNEPELQNTNPILAIPIMFARIAWRYRWTIIIYAVDILFLCYKIRKKQNISQMTGKVIFGSNMAIFIVNYFLSANMIGCVNIAFVLFGILLLLYIREWNKDDQVIIETFGIAGVSVVFSFAFSSDTGLDAMTIGFVILAIAMVLILLKNVKINENRCCWHIIVAVISFILLQSAFLRVVSVYRDAPLWELDTQITAGPGKYLYTTQKHEEQYNDLLNDIKQYVRTEDRVLYSKNCFWGYLCTDNEYATPSSWRMSMDSPRLEEYFTLNPEKYPTCVFVLKPEYGNFESSYIQNNERADIPNQNQLQGFLYNYIQKNNYEVIEAESAFIFRKRA